MAALLTRGVGSEERDSLGDTFDGEADGPVAVGGVAGLVGVRSAAASGEAFKLSTDLHFVGKVHDFAGSTGAARAGSGLRC